MCVHPAELQKAKSKAQNNNNLKEEANICNQLGELLSRNGELFLIFMILNLLLNEEVCT